jgi:hypothetical protein
MRAYVRRFVALGRSPMLLKPRFLFLSMLVEIVAVVAVAKMAALHH